MMAYTNDGIFPLKNLWPYKNVYMNVHQSIISNRQNVEFPNVLEPFVEKIVIYSIELSQQPFEDQLTINVFLYSQFYSIDLYVSPMYYSILIDAAL